MEWKIRHLSGKWNRIWTDGNLLHPILSQFCHAIDWTRIQPIAHFLYPEFLASSLSILDFKSCRCVVESLDVNARICRPFWAVVHLQRQIKYRHQSDTFKVDVVALLEIASALVYLELDGLQDCWLLTDCLSSAYTCWVCNYRENTFLGNGCIPMFQAQNTIQHAFIGQLGAHWSDSVYRSVNDDDFVNLWRSWQPSMRSTLSPILTGVLISNFLWIIEAIRIAVRRIDLNIFACIMVAVEQMLQGASLADLYIFNS